MKLDERTLRLIAVGASITANCQPCLEHSVNRALASGLDAQEITEAIEVGKMVRKGAASRLDEFARSLNFAVPASAPAAVGCCDS